MSIRRKIVAILIGTLLTFSILIINNFTPVQADRDDMNLEGDIYLNNTHMLANTTWRNETGFCIWVYHEDHWTRYPTSGWRSTNMGRYFYMLPSNDNSTHWSTGDRYRVQVNCEGYWNVSNTNYSSRGTGDPGEYTPAGAIDNYIVWSDTDNWQRWDIQVPGVDLMPTNVKVNDVNYVSTPTFISINASEDFTINANVTNIGTSENPTGFNFTCYKSTREGKPLTSELLLDAGIETPLSPNGGDTGEFAINWQAPSVPGVYFVALYADHYNVIPESNKTNNLFLIGFIVGGVPDLALTNIIVDEIHYDSSPSPLIYVGKDQVVPISANVMNIGTESTIITFNITFILTYDPAALPAEPLLAKTLGPCEPAMVSDSLQVGWTTPDFNTKCKIVIKVDPEERIQEIREDNNEFVLSFEVRDLPDLEVVSTTPVSQTVPVGSENNIGVKISNIGKVKADSSGLGFYNGSAFDSHDPAKNQTVIFRNYNVEAIESAQTLETEFQTLWIAPMVTGTYNVSVKVDIFDEVAELKEFNNILRFEFIVLDYPLPPVPRLEISNFDIILNWTHSPTANRAYYLIYRAESQTGFDFAKPYYNTSIDLFPMANSWFDAGAGYSVQELYYCIRTVNAYGWVGYSSITVGKYTNAFGRGYSMFGLPLEPFTALDAHGALEQVRRYPVPSVKEIEGITTIYQFDQPTQSWQGHPKFLPKNIDNFDLEMGKGYLIFTPEQVQLTFTGYPGSMIRYLEILPATEQFRVNLELRLAVEDNEVELSWDNISFASEYRIYSSSTRTGFDYSTPFGITQNISIIFELPNINEHYYTVIPADHLGRFGSSTYSVGVRCQGLGVGYNTFSLCLKPVAIINAYSILDEFFKYDIDTIYYYDTSIQAWRGHPKFVPAGVEDFKLELADAYMAYVYLDKVQFAVIGR